LVLFGASYVGAVAPCVEQCEKISEAGELRPGVSPVGCVVRVCQREARSLYQNNEFEQALESLEPLHEKLEHSPAYQLDRGLIFYGLGRFPEALEWFERILSGFPSNIRAGAQRGHTLVRLGRLDAARAQFEKLADDPASEGEFKQLRTRSYLRGNIGIVRLLQGDLEGGKADLERALEIDGRNQLARRYLSDVVPYLESGVLGPGGGMQLLVAYEELGFRRYLSAAKELRELVKRWPRFGPGYHRLGEILRSYQAYEACAAALQLGEKYLPGDIDLRAERLRCLLLYHGPTSEEARPVLERVRALAREHPENERLQQILVALDR
jgi:tetratricopeptide (TPR) repeat protein